MFAPACKAVGRTDFRKDRKAFDRWLGLVQKSAKRVAPAHYNTWPPIEQDAKAWADYYGIPFVEPVSFRTDPADMAKACWFADRSGLLKPLAKRIMQAIFVLHAFLSDHYSVPLFYAAIALFIIAASEELLIQLLYRNIDEDATRSILRVELGFIERESSD